MTGQLRVDLDFRPDTPVRLVGTIAGVPEIPSISSDLSQLRNQLTGLPLRELVDSAQQTFVSLRRLADHLDTEIDPLTASALHTMDAGTQTLQSTELAVRSVQADASTTLRDADLLLADAHHQLDGRGEELSSTLEGSRPQRAPGGDAPDDASAWWSRVRSSAATSKPHCAIWPPVPVLA